MDGALPPQFLVLLLLLQVKHAVADGPLQTLTMLKDKGFYGRPGGIAHAGIHGAGTLAVLFACGMAAPIVMALAAADAILHYHIDFAKETMVRRLDWTNDKPVFWWALQADQLLHQFTYVAIASAAIAMR
jgi:NAD(P)H-hydrate repair Nnr-like enzyme with NAD(P)H-hydrate dehydratase domain